MFFQGLRPRREEGLLPGRVFLSSLGVVALPDLLFGVEEFVQCLQADAGFFTQLSKIEFPPEGVGDDAEGVNHGADGVCFLFGFSEISCFNVEENLKIDNAEACGFGQFKKFFPPFRCTKLSGSSPRGRRRITGGDVFCKEHFNAAHHGLSAGRVGIINEEHPFRVSLQYFCLMAGQRGAARCNGALEPGLVQGNHIHIAFNQNGCFASPDLLLRSVETVEQL